MAFAQAQKNTNQSYIKISIALVYNITYIQISPKISFCIKYLLTPWFRILLEKLTGLQLVKKFPAFHGTRRFITALTSVRHLSLSWASPMQPIYPQPTSWRSILILSTYLRLGLPSGLPPSGFPSKIRTQHNSCIYICQALLPLIFLQLYDCMTI